MALAFLLLFPIGAVTARYFRSTFQPRQWFKVIIIINVLLYSIKPWLTKPLCLFICNKINVLIISDWACGCQVFQPVFSPTKILGYACR